MTGRIALGSVMDILYLAILFHAQPASTNSHYRFNQTPLQSDLTRPVRFSVPVSESNVSDQVVANLTALLWENTELPSRVSALLHEARFRPRYELLDVSANLMANLPPQRRVNFFQLVQLEPSTGAVRFTVPLDRERLCPDTIGTDQRCTISLLVAIHLTPINSSHFTPLTVYADLTVLVLDVNDNAPYFTSSNSADSAPLAVITVDEECPIGTMIQLPQAIDPDTQEHGVQRYEFHPTSTAVRVREHFDIVQFRRQPGLRCEDVTSVQLEMIQSVASADTLPVVPCLRTIRRLDRETVGDQFHFNLIATDTNGKRGEIAVQLLVRDINDHAPEWATKLELFDSSSRSHWISASPSDPAHGTESRRTHYTFSVPECTTQHKLIRLEAQDKDDPQQDGGKVTFRLSEHSPDRLITTLRRRLFVSNNHLYLTDRGLRGLAQPNLTIVVVASDGAGRNTEAWFHLRIEDCNDHRPMILIQNTDHITIPEESTGQSHLVSLITVRDFDLITSPNSQFSCFLNDTTYLELKEVVAGPKADDRDMLHSHLHQGDEITSAGDKEDLSSRRGRWSVYRLGSRSEISFDRETSALYTVMFECIDKGSPSLTASRPITIHIEDINDNAPQFITRCAPLPLSQNTKDLKPNRPCMPQFVFTVSEDAERGILIGSVRAVDLDSGENARVEYTLHSLHNNSTAPDSNESEVFRPETLFTVTLMGELHLRGELDRERQSYYEFLVMATDHGKRQRLSSTATVQITVADVNDCAPVFHGDYVFEVSLPPKV
ncbi:putative cadherin [Fasciola gigantica]|uniref:Putative cadherin n=1 Tax=Fasciola gigantica TaxID=46835 RepID=A0A504YTS1_FASGI|nr:putative cadherin [Fasciola gigantica]